MGALLFAYTLTLALACTYASLRYPQPDRIPLASGIVALATLAYIAVTNAG